MPVRSLGYVVVETRDLERWYAFATDILGVMPHPSPREDVLLFRIDDRPFRIWVEKSIRETLGAPGWQFGSAAEFSDTVGALRAAGHTVDEASAIEARTRNASGLARVLDPAGNAMELFHGRHQDCAPFASPTGISGFVTGASGDMGMGHIVLFAPNFEECHRFYQDLLGFADTDLARFRRPDDKTGETGLNFAFMHARNNRHHSLALAQLPRLEQGALHIMLEAATMTDVGRTYDRANRSEDVHIAATLGEHVNDRMVSFYMRSPSGFDIEYGYGGLVIDPDTWVPTLSDTPSIWGHSR